MKFNRYSAILLGVLMLGASFLNSDAAQFVDQDQINREQVLRHPAFTYRVYRNSIQSQLAVNSQVEPVSSVDLAK